MSTKLCKKSVKNQCKFFNTKKCDKSDKCDKFDFSDKSDKSDKKCDSSSELDSDFCDLDNCVSPMKKCKIESPEFSPNCSPQLSPKCKPCNLEFPQFPKFKFKIQKCEVPEYCDSSDSDSDCNPCSYKKPNIKVRCDDIKKRMKESCTVKIRKCKPVEPMPKPTHCPKVPDFDKDCECSDIDSDFYKCKYTLECKSDSDSDSKCEPIKSRKNM